jgi:pSer/pThr/pTyr-binding forkhead associated (FHA) protein
MAKLILSMDGLVLKEIPLAKERISIGRKPHNDIQIDNLAISGEHAVIVTLVNDSFLEDLDSTNGTYVNSLPVKKHFLQDGDVIELGKYRLKYLSEAGQHPIADDFEKTMLLRPDQLHGTVEQAAARGFGAPQTATGAAAGVPPPPASGQSGSSPQATAAPPAAQPGRAMIQVLTGSNAGKELELTKTLTTLGKPGVQVAVIARRPHGYFMTHVEGSNFPVIGGQRLEANKPHALNDHDIIELGGIKMEFFFKS